MLVEQLPILSLKLVDLRDGSCIAISDVSSYLSIPTSADLSMEITPPGYPTLNVPFTPLSVNVYKCVDLGITCSDTGCTSLPDGIYNVIYTVVPSGGLPNATINQNFVKIDNIKCKYEHAFLKLNVEFACHDHGIEKYLNQLKKVKLYINGCVVSANNNNFVLAEEFYNKAMYILEHLCCKFPSINWHSNCNTGVGWNRGQGLIGCNCH